MKRFSHCKTLLQSENISNIFISNITNVTNNMCSYQFMIEFENLFTHII